MTSPPGSSSCGGGSRACMSPARPPRIAPSRSIWGDVACRMLTTSPPRLRLPRARRFDEARGREYPRLSIHDIVLATRAGAGLAGRAAERVGSSRSAMAESARFRTAYQQSADLRTARERGHGVAAGTRVAGLRGGLGAEPNAAPRGNPGEPAGCDRASRGACARRPLGGARLGARLGGGLSRRGLQPLSECQAGKSTRLRPAAIRPRRRAASTLGTAENSAWV